MKFNTSLPIVNFQGLPFLIGKDQGGTPLAATTGLVAVEALMTPSETDKPTTGIEALRLLALARRVHEANGEMDLTPEEASTIRSKVEASFANPLVVGTLFEALDG